MAVRLVFGSGRRGLGLGAGVGSSTSARCGLRWWRRSGPVWSAGGGFRWRSGGSGCRDRQRCPLYRLGGAHRGQICRGEHGQGDMGVPGVVAADLVLIKPDLVSRGLKRFLDRPAGSGHPYQGAQPGSGGPGGVSPHECRRQAVAGWAAMTASRRRTRRDRPATTASSQRMAIT